MIDSVDDPALERILALVSEQAGVRLTTTRRADAEAGIFRAMRRAGIGEPLRYLQTLESGGVAFDALIAELTVRETYFFREPAHFDFVRREVIQEVFGRRGHGHALRAWSAGCASGEEAYSLAIVLEEEGLPSVILGTDISREALRAARDGTYGKWSLRGLDDGWIARWFRRTGERWQLVPRVRQSASFEFHNLLRHACPLLPAGIWGMDLILCRNVLIYLEKSEIERVACGLHDSLVDGGWLITGPSDPSLDGCLSLRAMTTEAGVFYRRSGPTWRAPTPSAPKGKASVAEIAPVDPVESPEALSLEKLALARDAFARGAYDRVRILLRDACEVPSALLYVQATANCCGPEEASEEARRISQALPLSSDLHFLEATLLIDSGRLEESIRALRRVLYLEPSCVIAHFFLGTVCRRQGKLDEAHRAYRNARDHAHELPPDQVLPLGEGIRAGALAEFADLELFLLHAAGGSS